jgi:hypothetical protein
MRDTTDSDLNVVFEPFRNAVLDFKDETKISWTVIAPAIQTLAARLFVKSRGLESARHLYSFIVGDIEKSESLLESAILEVQIPPSPPDHLVQVNAMLWSCANNAVAKGHPIEHVAQAFSTFSIMIAEKAIDPSYAKLMMKATYRELLLENFS